MIWGVISHIITIVKNVNPLSRPMSQLRNHRAKKERPRPEGNLLRVVIMASSQEMFKAQEVSVRVL